MKPEAQQKIASSFSVGYIFKFYILYQTLEPGQLSHVVKYLL